ncbi:MAG: hypothetical protein U0869_10765 [Chloroflexota bacterium]
MSDPARRPEPAPDTEPGVDARTLDRREEAPAATRPAGAEAVREHPANQSEAQAGPNAVDDEAERPGDTEPA